MEAIVEFHAFKDNDNQFIVKELAIVSSGFQCQVIFLPPYSKSLLNLKMQRTADWLEHHYHLIKWEEGHVPYDEKLIYTLCKPFSVLHTKGSEKAKFLKEFHPDVRELSITIPHNNDGDCLVHSRDARCALRTAKAYLRSLNA